MKNASFSLKVALIALAVAATTAMAYNVPKTPLSVEPPPGWTMNDTGQYGTYVIFRDQAQDGFAANFNVLSESMAGMAQEDYLDLSIKNIKKAIDSVDVKARQNMTIGGMSATALTYTGKSNNFKLTWYQVFVFYQGSAYIFTGTTLTKNADVYIPVFQRTFQTVRVAGSAPSQYTPPPSYQTPDYGTPPPSGDGKDK